MSEGNCPLVDDKEKHLSQLRDRLSELEVIIDTNSSLMENHRLHVQLKAVEEQKADLVVMQSHVPNLTDYIWPSNGGTVASHSRASVFVVR